MNLKHNIMWIVSGIYASCSVCYLLNLMMYPNYFSYCGLAVLLFGALMFLQKKFWDGYRAQPGDLAGRRRLKYALCFSFLLGLSFILGYQMSVLEMTSLGIKGKTFIFVVSMGVGMAIMPFVYGWFAWLERFKAKQSVEKVKKFFFVCWGVIFVCWIPAFLAYYPAIMSYDFHRQSQEAMLGYIWFNSHHPLVHTFLIRMFLLLGEAIGSYQIGMALFSLLQMLILSLVLAYCCVMVYRLCARKWALYVSAGIFALLPIHPVLALSMTKDILFTALFLLLLLLLLELNQAKSTKAVVWLFIACALTGILAMMFRNNAVYAFVLFAVFYIILSKKKRLLYAALCVIIVAGGLCSATGIQKAMNAGSGSKVEMFSVVIQQFARTGKMHRDFLTEKEWSTINRYVLYEDWEGYNPPLADTVKGSVAVYAYPNWKDDIPRMLKDWVTIGLHYPNDYIDAFLALTSGYWFLDDVTHAEVLGYGEDTNLGLLYTFNASQSANFEGVESHSFLPGVLKIYQKIVNGNAYYKWPVISNLFKPAFYCWILMLVLLSLMYLKKWRKTVLCLWPLTYLFTLYLGPVVNMRYVYPIIVSVPLLLAWLFSEAEWSCGKESRDKLCEESK